MTISSDIGKVHTPFPTRKTKPRRVNFFQNSQDLQAAVMGSLGFSTEFIATCTKLSPCQVLYRLGKAKVKRSDYRNGHGQVSLLVGNRLRSQVTEMVRAKISGDLKDQAKQDRQQGRGRR